MSKYKGIAYLRRKLINKKIRVDIRYNYYDMKNSVKYLKGTIPPEFRWMASTLGWCGKAVDSIADRLMFNEFREDNFGLNEIYDMNNRDILFDSGILSSVLTSCCFIYISNDEDGYPRLQIIDGGNATGEIDPITYMLTEGYAVLHRDEYGIPTSEAYFIKGQTIHYEKGKAPYITKNVAPYPLLVPVIYRPDARRPFGHSRISRACMDIQQAALRTLFRSEVSAEFYSFPQKYITGLDDGVEFNNKAATMASFLALTKDSEGDKPAIGQFSQQSMSPYVEQLKALASLFAGETGLTLDDLGFNTVNPSSSEAIKAAHENLRLTARKAQRTLGIGFLNAGYLSACLRDNFPYLRRQIYLTSLAWEPCFEPDASALSGIGDGILKLNQAMPGFVDENVMGDLTGIRK